MGGCRDGGLHNWRGRHFRCSQRVGVFITVVSEDGSVCKRDGSGLWLIAQGDTWPRCWEKGEAEDRVGDVLAALSLAALSVPRPLGQEL